MPKNIEIAASNNNVTKAIFVGSIIGVSIGYATLFSCVSNTNNMSTIRKTNATALVRKEVNNINTKTYVSTVIIGASVSLGLIGFLRVA